MTPHEKGTPEPPARLKPLRLRGNVARWAIAAALLSSLGLLLLTGLASSPWLFLLYPLLIGTLLASLGVLALHLLHRI